MDVGSIYKILMPLNLGLFAVLFFGIYFYQKKLVFLAWIGLGFVAGTIATLIGILQNKIDWHPLYFDDISNPLFWSIGAFVTVGMAIRNDRKVPVKTIAILSAIGIIGQYYFRHVDVSAQSLAYVVNIVAGSLMGLAARIAWISADDMVEKAVGYLLTAISLSYFLRLFIVFGLIDAELSFDNYAASLHVVILLVTSSFFAVSGALSMLLLAALDVVDIYRSESTTDMLTGLCNRRGLREHIETRKKEDDLEGSHLILCDLDHFKEINDNFGHQAGDMALRRVGHRIEEIAESFGFAARLGGEEFAILTEPLDCKTAWFAADQIRHAIGKITHDSLGSRDTITVSVGIARISSNQSVRDGYALADAALYKAKTEGRNRVVAAPVEAADTPDNPDQAVRKVA